MEVTVHQADITAHGWTGSGYIVLDPETGAGAYKISGGANGAFAKLLYWAGILAYIAENYPFFVDVIGAAIGVFVNAISTYLDLMECANSSFVLAMVAVVAVSYLILDLILAISGIGFIISVVVNQIASKAFDALVLPYIISSPLCRRNV
jgi:hypothetical protein